jgi:hypothetical protein
VSYYVHPRRVQPQKEGLVLFYGSIHKLERVFCVCLSFWRQLEECVESGSPAEGGIEAIWLRCVILRYIPEN